MSNSVYIHIPFCQYKCHYCDFNSYKVDGQPVLEYLKALDKEMELTVSLHPPSNIKTIFVGGGTPSILAPKELEILFKSIKKHFPVWNKHDFEFTVEANPGSVELDKLQVMKEYGVNRISMGVEAFQDELLQYIGRIHTVRDAYDSIENAYKIGITNINIDLMFGLPKQTLEMMKESLKKAIALDLPHYSIYSLKVEENTLFDSLYQKGKLPLPDEESELQMFLLTIEELKKNGYKHYEISNFAKSGYESKHNMNYWKNGYYYGIGAGAHGYINDIRNENIKGINPYIKMLLESQSLPRFDEYQVTAKDKMENMMILGLRLLDGVSYREFKEAFSLNLRKEYQKEMDKLIHLGLLMEDNQGIRLTKKGLIYGNNVFAEFIS